MLAGTTSVRTTVLKDGHVFAVHILNPREGEEENTESGREKSPNLASKTEEPEKAEFEKSEKGKYTNVLWVPSDGNPGLSKVLSFFLCLG